MQKVKWDDYYMTMAYLVAMKSKDESTHVGAVVVGPDNEVRSTGYNSFPRGIDDDKPERQERPEKYFWFEHAERNAIYNSSLMGLSLKDCKMFTNGIPCMNCARAIVQAGIAEVVVDAEWDKNNYGQWVEEAKRTKILFKEAGVRVRFWEGKIIDIIKFRNKKEIKS